MRIDVEIVDGEQIKTTEFGDRVVPCPNCGADVIWIEDDNGWIACDVESSGQEPAIIHYCSTPPDFLEQEIEDKDNPELENEESSAVHQQ